MADAEAFTIGIEEEFQLVDPDTRELCPQADRVMPEAKAEVGDEVTNELYLSQIEIGTPVCKTLADVRGHLVYLRKTVSTAAGHNGSRLAAAGTHPFSHWGEQPLTPKERYQHLSDEYQQLIREQLIFGCHVHVGIADPDAAVRVMNRLRPWIPPLIALAANSPFWLGTDTGYASYRTELFSRFPTSGLPIPLASRAEFDKLVADLIAADMIEDGTKIYWDIRPSAKVPTIEFRAADVCLTIDEAVMNAGLCRGLARACHAADAAGGPIDHARPELLQAAKWHACRYGLTGVLCHPQTGKAVPAADAVHAVLDFLRPTLTEHGEWDEVSGLVRKTLERGNGADRQRAVFARTGRLEDVVDCVLGETTAGM